MASTPVYTGAFVGDVTGNITGSAAITGTTGNTFTVDSDSVIGKMIFDVAYGAADKSLTWTHTALTDNRTFTAPNADVTFGAGFVTAAAVNLGAAVTTVGAVSISSTLTTVGAVSIAGTLTLPANFTVSGAHAVTLVVPGEYTYTFPAASCTLANAADGPGAATVTNASIAANANIDVSKIAVANGKLLVGSASSVAVAYTMTGDGTLSNAGVFAIAANSIVDADVNTGAAIALSKLGANDLGSFTGAVVPGTDCVPIIDGGTLKSGTYQVFMDGIADLTAGAIQTGDSLLFIDSNASSVAVIETIDDIATLFAGDGLTATSAVMALDVGNLATACTDSLALTDRVPMMDASGASATKYLTGQLFFDGLSNLAAAVIATTNTIPFTVGGVAKLETIDDLFGIGPALLTEAAIAVADDYVVFLDGGATGACKKEKWADVATALAGTAATSGLTATNGVLAYTPASITAAAIAAADSFVFVDAGDSLPKLESVADFATMLAGTVGTTGLVATSSVLAFTPASITAGAIADGDSIVFSDVNDSGLPKLEALADVVSLMAGAGLSAANSVLSATAQSWCIPTGGEWKIDGTSGATGGIAGAANALDVTSTACAAAFAYVSDASDTTYPLSTCSSAAGYTANFQCFPDAEAESDFVAFGAAVPFCSLLITVATPAVYNAKDGTIWEYSKTGATWGTLTLATLGDFTDTDDQDGDRSFQRTGTIHFVPPTDWTSEEGHGSQSAYWIRCRVIAAPDITTIPILSDEPGVQTPAEGFKAPFAGTVTDILIVDKATTVHSGADVKFFLMNFTTGASTAAITFPQDQRSHRQGSLTLTVAAGDILWPVVTQEDGTNEVTNADLVLNVTPS